MDDALDFVSTSSELGKPAGADLSLGLATGPILFAAQKVKDVFCALYFLDFDFLAVVLIKQKHKQP